MFVNIRNERKNTEKWVGVTPMLTLNCFKQLILVSNQGWDIVFNSNGQIYKSFNNHIHVYCWKL